MMGVLWRESIKRASHSKIFTIIFFIYLAVYRNN